MKPGLELLQAIPQAGIFFFECIHFSLEGLDGGEGHTICIDRGDAFVRASEAESGAKILGHGTDVPDTVFAGVAPL